MAITDLVLRLLKYLQRDPVIREWKNSFVDRAVVFRASVHWRQNPHATPAIGRFSEQQLVVSNDERVFLDELLCSRTRSFDWQRLRVFGATEFFDRTNSAFRFAWETH